MATLMYRTDQGQTSKPKRRRLGQLSKELKDQLKSLDKFEYTLMCMKANVINFKHSKL